VLDLFLGTQYLWPFASSWLQNIFTINTQYTYATLVMSFNMSIGRIWASFSQ